MGAATPELEFDLGMDFKLLLSFLAHEGFQGMTSISKLTPPN